MIDFFLSGTITNAMEFTKELHLLVKDFLFVLKEQKDRFFPYEDCLIFPEKMTLKAKEAKGPFLQKNPLKKEPPSSKLPPQNFFCSSEKEYKPPPKAKVSSESFEGMKKIFQEIAPEVSLRKTIPDDAKALQLSQKWKLEKRIFELSFLIVKETPEERQFLDKVAKALEVHFFPSSLLEALFWEKEESWETFLASPQLKMIFISQSSFQDLPSLQKHYKEAEALLGSIPLFLLSPPSLYLKDPSLKAFLWKELCHKISPLK